MFAVGDMIEIASTRPFDRLVRSGYEHVPPIGTRWKVEGVLSLRQAFGLGDLPQEFVYQIRLEGHMYIWIHESNVRGIGKYDRNVPAWM